MIISFEGIDGSGKATALATVAKALRQRRMAVEELSFPRYGETAASELVAAILRSKEIAHNAYYIATAFALDRHESLNLLSRDNDALILCDRYTASNVAFQAARLPTEERAAFRDWLIDFEFSKLAIPKPDLCIYFDIDVEAASELIASKAPRAYTDDKYDAFERDRAYQREVAAVYQELRDASAVSSWSSVAVTRGGKLRSREEIAKDALGLIEAHLSRAGKRPTPSVAL